MIILSYVTHDFIFQNPNLSKQDSGIDYIKETFAISAMCFKKEPGLKIFLVLYDEKSCLLLKRT